MGEVYLRGKVYWVRYTGLDGKTARKSTRQCDRRVAERMLAREEDELTRRRHGLFDPAAEAMSREAARPVRDHLNDFRVHLEAADRTAKHVESTLARIEDMIGSLSLRSIEGLTPDAINRYASGLRKRPSRYGGVTSPATVVRHLAAIKGFSRWLTQHGKLQRDPLAAVKKPEGRRQTTRRILLREEWVCL